MESPIVFITKAYHHYETLIQVLKKHSLNYPVYYGKDSDECLCIAKKLVDSGVRVIISTDYLCKFFMPTLNVSLISIRRSGYSFVSCAIEELKTNDKLAILSRVGGYSFGRAAEEARSVDPEHIYTFEYSDEDEVPRILKKLKASGFKSIICPSWIGPLASDYGMHYTYIFLPEPDILEAIQHAEFQLKVNQRQLLSKNLISSILNLSNEGIAALDDSGAVLDINDYACHLLDSPKESIIEKNYSNTILNIFDYHKCLSQHTEVKRNILTFHDQMFVYDTRSVIIDNNIKAQIIIFNSAQQIKETERSIRLKELKQGSIASATFSSIVGSSSGIIQAINKAKKYAAVNSTVLISAPSGSGKELFAQSIHNASARSTGPFVVINCAALPESVLESLLFGYEPGTFTGGRKEGKAGLFELAHNGTVFLDEVSEMPLNIQARFLRVLQEREVVRIGGNRSIPIDIRVLAATNRNMTNLIQKGLFREDLYHRISTLLLEIPPLSERISDIPELAHYFIFKRAKELNLSIHGITPEAVKFLEGLNYSGNIRQLNNILERAMVLSEKNILHLDDIKNALPREKNIQNQSLLKRDDACDSLKDQVAFSEKNSILDALQQCNGNRTRAAGILGISTATLWRKMKSLGIL